MSKFAADMGNAKALFAEAVTTLVTEFKERPVDERNTAIKALCDEYVQDMNEAPPAPQLERLANLILREELTAMHKPDVEYPLQSASQDKLRTDRQRQYIER